ncbi:hypothetical protein CYLTODRAFT_422208 [Cylindrobasidium torrendii FP15055 ss-10]|uniref:Phosphatidate cytidylyltransferase n=1 Tax=Cylindrobasidium torrendii FP15055 ss-10 TaxID=1314674 RepID=A0A0D7BC88_9AGAR|nr:hypothetical protein CYLTODRAFT_422208 [Cylindrobasidium torrendii FP15055 ss-10]
MSTSSRLTSTVMRRLEGLGEHTTSPTPESSRASSPPGSPTQASPAAGTKGKEAVVGNGLAATGEAGGKGKGIFGLGGVRKTKWEIPRKVFHSSIGFLTLYLYLLPLQPPFAAQLALLLYGPSSSASYPFTEAYSRDVLVPGIIKALMTALLAVIIPADILRLTLPSSPFASLYNTLLGPLMRPSELQQPNGVIFYILGVSWSLRVYRMDVAVYSILALSWADTAASTVGRALGSYTGRIPWAKGKSWAGFIGAAVVGGALATAFWPEGEILDAWVQGGGGEGVLESAWAKRAVLAVYAGVTTALAESVDLGGWVDDNLTLPILSGAALALLC